MMKFINIVLVAILAVMSASCGHKKNYRNPEEIDTSKELTETLSPKPVEETAEPDETYDDGTVLTEMVSNERPSIVDFTATWCGPCQKMKPIFHSLAKDFRDEYNFISIDIDENPELANKYQVQAVPTFVFLDADGNEGNRITGMISEKEFRDELLSPAWY